MVRLQEQLKYFVVKKVSQDPLWKDVRVYLSGHEVGIIVRDRLLRGKYQV